MKSIGLKASKAPTNPKANGNWGRRSTISSEFYRSIAPTGHYDVKSKEAAIAELEQDDLNNLACVYCRNAPAKVWDHIFHIGGSGLGEGARRGHHLRNLVPACKTCNNAKGTLSPALFFASDYMIDVVPDLDERARRFQIIERYSAGCETQEFEAVRGSPLWEELWGIYKQIETLLKRADEIATDIRTQ